MTTIEDYMAEVSANIRNRAGREMMTIGSFIAALEALEAGKTIRMDFSYYGPGRLDSYRGYYDHLSLMGLNPDANVGIVLADARAAIGATFTGYKGGEYRMDERTPLWWATAHGDCHDTGVVDVSDEGYCAVIHTAFTSF